MESFAFRLGKPKSWEKPRLHEINQSWLLAGLEKPRLVEIVSPKSWSKETARRRKKEAWHEGWQKQLGDKRTCAETMARPDARSG